MEDSGGMKTAKIMTLLFAFVAVTSVASLFLLFQIDNTVKVLDSYGLQYDNTWLRPYSRLTMTTFGLILFNVALSVYVLFFLEPASKTQPAVGVRKKKAVTNTEIVGEPAKRVVS